MAGIRLVVGRPTPPAPSGASYLTDNLGRILFGDGLLITGAIAIPEGFALLVDDLGNAFVDDAGVMIVVSMQQTLLDEDGNIFVDEAGDALLAEIF